MLISGKEGRRTRQARLPADRSLGARPAPDDANRQTANTTVRIIVRHSSSTLVCVCVWPLIIESIACACALTPASTRPFLSRRSVRPIRRAYILHFGSPTRARARDLSAGAISKRLARQTRDIIGTILSAAWRDANKRQPSNPGYRSLEQSLLLAGRARPAARLPGG